MQFLNRTLSETLTQAAESQICLTLSYAIFLIALFVYLYTGILMCEGRGGGKRSAKNVSVSASASFPLNDSAGLATTVVYENMNWLIELQDDYSPLNIHKSDVAKARKLEALRWENHNTLPSIMFLENNGQSAVLQAIYPYNKPMVHGASLPSSCSFVQVTFRWGADHMLEDREFPLEMQVLYRFDSEEQEEEELSSQDTLVVAFIFDVGEYNESLRPITDNLKHIPLPSSKVRIPTVPLGTIMPLYVGGFYCYVGSMVEPPFYGGLKWSVYSRPLTVGKDQLEEFRALLGCDRKPIKSNGRPAKRARS